MEGKEKQLERTVEESIIDLAKTQLAEEHNIDKHFVKVNLPQELLERCIQLTMEYTMKSFNKFLRE